MITLGFRYREEVLNHYPIIFKFDRADVQHSGGPSAWNRTARAPRFFDLANHAGARPIRGTRTASGQDRQSSTGA